MSKKKKKKRKLNYRKVFNLLLFIVFIICFILYINNLNIKRIYITGNSITKDYEIIEYLNIKDYPKIYKLNINEMKNNLLNMDLISQAKVKRNILGKLTIEVVEDKPLFYIDNLDKVVTSSNKLINNSNSYLGLPTIKSNIESDLLEELVNAFNKIDTNILNSISEIEYSPSIGENNKVIDDKRFILYMNDFNEVIINLLNIEKLNDYLLLVTEKTNNMGDISGIFYLDSSSSNIIFTSFESLNSTNEVEDGKD
jgi:cell division septal protein FtsQ